MHEITAAGLHQSETQESTGVLIKRAMLAKVPVSVLYDGGERLVCPYILGKNKEGQVRLLCLQYGGASRSGLQHKDGGDWRCLSLDKISRLQLLFGEPWQTAPSAPGRPKCMDQIDMQVD